MTRAIAAVTLLALATAVYVALNPGFAAGARLIAAGVGIVLLLVLLACLVVTRADERVIERARQGYVERERTDGGEWW